MTDTELAALPLRGPRPRGGLLRRRDFRLLWTGETTSTLGSAAAGVALPIVALRMLDAGPFVMGLLTAAAWLPWLVVGLPAGAWIDRLPRRPTMIVCNAVAMLLVASVPLAHWMGVLSIAQLVVVCLLCGAVGVFFSPAYQAYLPSLVASEDLGEGNAKLQGGAQAAVVAGSSLGGLLAQSVSAMLGLLADAVSYLVSTYCLLRIRGVEPSRPAARSRQTTLRAEIRAGFSFVVRDPYLRVLAAAAAVDNFLLTAGQSLLVIFLIRTVHAAPTAVGVLLAADCLGGVFGAMVANRIARRLGTARALLAISLGSTPFGLLIPLTHNGAGLGFFAAGLLIPSAGIVANNVIGGTFRQTYCPSELLGRTAASGSFLAYSLMPAGALLGGALAGAIGVRQTLWIVLAAGLLGKGILLLGPIRKQRDFPPQPAAPDSNRLSTTPRIRGADFS